MGGEVLIWRQLTHSQLMSPQGPHFSPHNTAKTNDKSTNLKKNGIYWYKWCVTASVYLEKTRLKKLMITFFHGCQKLTSAMKLRLDK